MTKASNDVLSIDDAVEVTAGTGGRGDKRNPEPSNDGSGVEVTAGTGGRGDSDSGIPESKLGNKWKRPPGSMVAGLALVTFRQIFLNVVFQVCSLALPFLRLVAGPAFVLFRQIFLNRFGGLSNLPFLRLVAGFACFARW
ncbi:hypothetical protein [Crateriforma conspicua]|uniref:hypothetical protein n=1 Tax=Crateriforma conspicua TaxID=2527996 RepID=UPI0013FD0A65|nr:hypothetical protein [Crateriforma conspicua]